MPPYHWDMRRGLYFVLMVVLVLRGLTGTAMAAGVLPPLLPASAPHAQEHSHVVAAEAAYPTSQEHRTDQAAQAMLQKCRKAITPSPITMIMPCMLLRHPRVMVSWWGVLHTITTLPHVPLAKSAIRQCSTPPRQRPALSAARAPRCPRRLHGLTVRLPH